jgi:hypothetical protein
MDGTILHRVIGGCERGSVPPLQDDAALSRACHLHAVQEKVRAAWNRRPKDHNAQLVVSDTLTLTGQTDDLASHNYRKRSLR